MGLKGGPTVSKTNDKIIEKNSLKIVIMRRRRTHNF